MRSNVAIVRYVPANDGTETALLIASVALKGYKMQ